jgi:hypothetical protein
VAILNQTLAKVLWPHEAAVGRQISFKGQTIAVIGIVRDIKGRDLFEPPGPMMYLPLSQHYQPATVLHVRAALPAAQIVPIVRSEVQTLDRNLPVYSAKTLDEHVAATLTPQRLLAQLVSAFGTLAFLLAAAGLYGLLSWAVIVRTQEIGIRLALGAKRRDIVNLFVGRGMRVAAAGVGFGLVAAAGLMRLMTSVLFGVSPLDPLTLLTVSTVLIAAGCLACYVPARRAARADPKIALRCE